MAENERLEQCEIQDDCDNHDSLEDIELDGGICGCDVRFRGSKRISSKWMQRFATARWALFFLSTSAMLQVMVANGLLSVVISTLEKRFELRSTESGLIVSFYGIAAFVATIFVTFANESLHKTKGFSFGTVLSGLGALVIALPHFIAPIYSFVELQEQNYCGNVTLKECSDNSRVRDYRFIFIAGVSLLGAGSCFQHTLGVTYLDENVSKENSAVYNSLYFAIAGLGPAIGFILGGASLNLYTYLTVSANEVTIDSGSDLWVGAWWLSFAVSGMALLTIAIPVWMLPRHLPGTAKYRDNRDIEMQKMKSGKRKSKRSTASFRDFLILARNKPYVFVILGSAVNYAFIFGFNTFGTKYVETVFGLSPFNASVLYGTSAIFSCFVGQVAGGYFIKCMSLTMRGIIKLMALCGIFSALCSFAFLIHCEDIDIAGGTAPYPNTTLVQSQFSECNSDCDCSTDLYEPVCNKEVTYFSPCFAGCTDKLNDTTYGSCSCVANFSSSPEEALVSSEWCNRKPCRLFIVFAVVVLLCFISSLVTIPPAYQVTLRCVPFEKRMMAISVQRMAILAIGSIPGRILTGAVMDRACVSWSTECGEQGSCRGYRRWDVARNNTILLCAQTFVCAILYILVYVAYDPVDTVNEGGEADKESKTVGVQPESINREPDLSRKMNKDSSDKNSEVL